ncbi:unnamed protein product [Rangifer tarandus platyrhynchus]|uniref:Uncharacterized protein n=2 Tax=Rangifer tarandus platyrhynchus TaxID=3082113 RepID=A0AC60A649_RANTA|nr:unnamed protein product [Rangifer tarandus platyrhynchus]
MRELVVKNGAAHQCLLQPPSSLPRSPTAITKTPSTALLQQDAFVFIKTKHIVYLVGEGGGGNGTQSGFSPPNFSRSFLRPLPLKKKQNYFRHTKYLYKYYLLVSCYSSFGCKL